MKTETKPTAKLSASEKRWIKMADAYRAEAARLGLKALGVTNVYARAAVVAESEALYAKADKLSPRKAYGA